MLGFDRFAIQRLEMSYYQYVLANRRFPKYWRLAKDSIGHLWYEERGFPKDYGDYQYALAVVH